MKRLSILASMLAMACLPMMAQKTGSKGSGKSLIQIFQIYLCFGQSNMEGNAAIEDIDRTGVNLRFQAMYAVDDEKGGMEEGTMAHRRAATGKTSTGLTPADLFPEERWWITCQTHQNFRNHCPGQAAIDFLH